MTPIAGLLLVFGPFAGWLVWSRLPPARRVRGRIHEADPPYEPSDESDDLLDTGFATLLCAVFLTGTLALLLAEFGVLRPLALLGSLAAVSAVLWRLPRRSPPRRPISIGHLTAAALVATLGVVTLAPASEDLLGGRDPGAYANTAAWIANHGSLRVYSDALATLPRDSRHVFLGSVLLPGFYLGDTAQGEVIPQFLHLLPVYMALGHWLGGIAGGFLVPPLIGVLAELAVFFFVRRTLGLAAALLASAVLALNLAQMWGLRNPYSEGATQLGLFASLWCLAAAQATGGLRWGILGGLALGVCFLLRVDSLLLLIALLPALSVLAAGGPREQRWLTAAFLPLALGFALWASAHAWWYSRPYVVDLGHLVGPLWGAAAGVAALSALALWQRTALQQVSAWLHAHGTRVWLGCVVTLCTLFVFAMWIRPHLEPFRMHPTRGVRTYTEEALVRVAWYVSTAGAVLALGGVLALLRRWLVDRQVEWLPFLSALLAFSLLYLSSPSIAPDHPWMMRRFLPVVVPGMAVAIAAFAAFAWRLPARWSGAARALTVVAIATVLVHESLMAAPFWTFREKRGLVGQLDEFAQHIPERSIVLFSYPGADAQAVTPLALHWGRDVLTVIRDARNDPTGDRRRGRFEVQVMRWLRQGRPVLYLTATDADSIFLTRDIRWEETARLRLTMPSFGTRRDGPPRGPVTLVNHYRLLRAMPALEQPLACAGSAVYIDGRLGGVTQGFLRVETHEHERFYQSAGPARVMFPSCDRSGDARPHTVRASAACATMDTPAGCRVEIAINGRGAGVLDLSRTFENHDVPVPPAAIAGDTGAIEVRFTPLAERAPDRTPSFLLTSVSLVGDGTPR